MPSRTRKIQSSPNLVTRNRCTRAMQSGKNQTHRKLTKKEYWGLNLSIYFVSFLWRLTSTFWVGAFLLYRGREVRFSCLLVSFIPRLHVGLTPVPMSAVVAVLMPTVVSILTMAAPAMSCLAVAVVMVAMFLDLSLCQQACGLPSARASLVLLVLPIELSINWKNSPLIN